VSTSIQFSGICGRQGKRQTLVTAWSIRTLLRLTRRSYERLILNAKRDIDQHYLAHLMCQLKDEDTSLLSGAILLAVLGETRVSPMEGNPAFCSMLIDPAAYIEIVDGLHRIAALRALKTPPDHLKDASIAVQVSVFGDWSEVVQSRRQAAKRNRRMRSLRRDKGV